MQGSVNNLDRIHRLKRDSVRRCVEIARKNSDVRKLIVFGSSITDNCTYDSDIDLCLDVVGGTRNLSLFNTVSDMSIACNGECDILIYDKLADRLRNTIDRKGVTVYELS